MQKKVTILVLILGLLFSVSLMPVAAAGTESFTVNDYTNWIPAAPLPDGPITKFIADKVGINLAKVALPAGADPVTKMQLDMATGNLGDMIVSQQDNTKLIDEKLVIPLDKYFSDAKNYPNLAKVDKKLISAMRYSDGHIYAIQLMHQLSTKYMQFSPGIFQWSSWLVDASLVKRAGMKLTDIATMAGFEKYLRKVKTLKDADGKNIIPLSWDPQSSSDSGELKGAFGIQGYQPSSTAMNPDWLHPNYVKMMKWLSRINREGLLDPDALSQTWDTFKAKIGNGRFGAVMGHCGTDIPLGDQAALAKFSDNAKNHVVLGWMVIPAPKTPGIKVAPYSYGGAQGWGPGRMITAACKNPDKVMKWLDYLYSPEGIAVAYNGVPGGGLKQNANGTLSRDDAWWDARPDWADQIKAGWWYWMWAGSPSAYSLGPINGKKLTPAVDTKTATDRKMYNSGVVHMAEGSFVAQPAWMSIPGRADGAGQKYNATIADTIKKYRGKMIMAGSDQEVADLYQQMVAENKDRGHSDQVLKELFEDYKAYLATPSGQAVNSFKVSNKFLEDGSSSTIMPVEKNIPGVLYNIKKYITK